MKLYLVRHGETDYNRQKLLQGQTDILLNAKGRAQAVKKAEKLKDVHFDVVYTSPLQRAVETGELISKIPSDTYIRDKRIMEIGFGEAEGVPFDQLWDGFDYFFRAPEKYIATNGAESMDSLFERVKDFLLEIKDRPYENVLVLSHGAAIHAMLQFIGGYDRRDFWSVEVGNCAICEIEYKDGKFTLIQIDN